MPRIIQRRPKKPCEGIFDHKIVCRRILDVEITVEKACDILIRDLEHWLAARPGEYDTGIEDWYIHYFPPVEDEANTKLADVKGDLRMVFSETSDEPELKKPLGIAIDGWERVFHESSILKKRFEQSAKDLWAKLGLLEDSINALYDENKRLWRRINTLQDENQKLWRRFNTLRDENQKLRDRRSTLEDENKILRDRISTLERQNIRQEEEILVLEEDLEQLSELAYPLLLRILIDDARAEVAKRFGSDSWRIFKHQASEQELCGAVKANPNFSELLSSLACQLIWDGNRIYPNDGNRSSDTAPTSLIRKAVLSVVDDADRTAFEKMFAFAYPK
ncbi:hypothetical protein MD484_g7870, partial [Candolleomyces efflorescens]